MKKVIVVITILLTVAPIKAWEFPENPDRYPSVSLGYSGGSFDGTGEGSVALFTTIPGEFAFGSTRTENKLDTFSIMPSVRLPIGSNVTLDFFANFGDKEFQVQGDGLDFNSNMSGEVYGGSIRIYLK